MQNQAVALTHAAWNFWSPLPIALAQSQLCTYKLVALVTRMHHERACLQGLEKAAPESRDPWISARH